MRYIAPFGMPPDSPWINGDPTIGRQGSIPPAEAFEHPLRELHGLIENAGIVPSSLDLTQLTQAVRSQYVNFTVDTGSQNELSCDLRSPTIRAYTQGLPVRVLVGTTNTGDSWININNIGRARIIRPDGFPVFPEDLRQGML